ncbi:alkaline phosphatase D family protein [Aeromicrobium stalagmiti]|uniref:alkaline phosphatase D family protein n=1 Tax=Aeromicrobium stalagmiti TaxID=2738988 RepID=UPI00156A0D54|nr:alkaline phosphatase D family protein [Aeromicrobium stalagmiti]NRQ50858.1 alkaline phosphatase D family protein [Aeromicrobium stalagmiti]
MPTTRRDFLTYGAAIGAGAMTPVIASGAADARVHALKLPRDPFTLGVAAGDPEPDGFVIWTRLAVDPLADDGLGGMPNLRIPVSWQVATDERFRRVVRRGVSITTRELGHAIHVEVDGLQPGREYWYRFAAGPHLSRSGRAVTAPRRDAMPAALAMSFVSCSQYEHGLFTAYRRLAEDRPDLVLHLGDYQYEYTANAYVAPGGNVRDHDGPETTTLESYRQRHAQYKLDPDLQEAHAATAWAVVFDDHEVDNNWAADIPEKPAETPGFVTRRKAAFRAYYENMPLRRTSVPRGASMQLYRRLHWGRLATFHMLDTRQFRDDQGCGDGYKTDCPAAIDPKRSITGQAQEDWLLDGFNRSRARWDVLGQQVFFAQRDSDQGPLKTVSMDGWDGYAASRDRITRGWVDAGVRNPVVLTGDVHAHWASELKLDYDDPTTRSVGTELVCSSITSGGNGADSAATAHPWLQWNPHLKFQNNLRGYVNTTITPDDLTADFRCVAQVRTPGEPVFTRASFVVEDRVPALNLTYDRGLEGPDRLLRRSDRDVSRETIEWETQRP